MSHNGEATHNRDAAKCRKNFDEVFTSSLHKDTTANTELKQQIAKKDLPVGMRSRTIYTPKP